MNTTLKVTKYQLYGFYKAVLVFYAIIFAVSLGATALSLKASERVTFGGLGTATIIFISIAGMDCFKTSFMFMTANNVTRRRFYHGTLIALVALAAFMALVDTALNGILSSMFRYESLLEQLYGFSNYPAEYLWSFGLYAFAGCLGWLITMVYYRISGPLRIIVLVVPFIMGIPIGYMVRRTGGALGRAVVGFLDGVMGITAGNPYIGAFSFFVSAAVVLLFCFLLIRRAPIKD
ncbi:MAG TPA: hypothetical protein VFF83_05245 [Clostridia bacterium]|jgi:hypothetical protein|nr:hypothetical protein [Clostridia bacterium]